MLTVEIICGRRLITSRFVPCVETPGDAAILLLRMLRAVIVASGAVIFPMLGDNIRHVVVTELTVI